MLARTVFHSSVSEMLERVTAEELTELEAEYSLEPWGEIRSDIQGAIVACTVASTWSGKGSKPKVEDFMPKFDTAEPEPMTHEEAVEHLRLMNALMGGREK